MGWISREDYVAYLGSQQWKAKRRDALQRAGFVCERCGSTSALEVHHKHYRTLREERAEDLEVLCGTCHKPADQERASEGARRSKRARLNAWARKVYGDDWAERMDYHDVAQDFDDWLQDR